METSSGCRAVSSGQYEMERSAAQVTHAHEEQTKVGARVGPGLDSSLRPVEESRFCTVQILHPITLPPLLDPYLSIRWGALHSFLADSVD
jgi:hypothetical protein